MFTKSPEWYERNHEYNKNILEEYSKNIALYLSRTKDSSITSHKILNNIKLNENPKVAFVKFPSPGNMEIKETSLLKYINYLFQHNRIITPSGSTYIQPTIRESHFRKYINIRKKERKKIKQQMLQYESKGDKDNALFNHFRQLAIKIKINAATGILDKNVYYKFTSGYNSITSTARHNVICGYATIERFLSSNFYFKNLNDTINHVICLLRIYPGDNIIKKCIDKYKLRIPDINDIRTFLLENTYILNKSQKNVSKLDKLLLSLSDLEKAFIFYAQSLDHVFRYNEQIFKPYLLDLLDFNNLSEELNNIINNKDYSIKISDLDDPDLVILVMIILSDLLKGKTLNEVEDKYPDIKYKILRIYYILEYKLSYLEDLWNTFFLIRLNIHKPFEHPNIIRKSTILSDTDSNIFTTIRWVYWLYKKISLDKQTIIFHNLLVYFVTKIVEHVLTLSCKDCNVNVKDLKKVSMKNEYLYLALVRTIMNKHYFGYISIKEGVVLPKYKLDIKGKNFKGSDFSKYILSINKEFIIYILDNITKNQEINKHELISKVIQLEINIYKDIKNRNNTYLHSIPIKHKSEYKDALVSYYFKYLLWEEVFADKYYHINIPDKVKCVHLNTKITYNNIDIILKDWKDLYPDVFQKFKTFLSKYPKKSIDNVIIPFDSKIPIELIKLIDYKKIIYSNLIGIYLMLQSLGLIYFNSSSCKLLFSEIYTNIKFE